MNSHEAYSSATADHDAYVNMMEGRHHQPQSPSPSPPLTAYELSRLRSLLALTSKGPRTSDPTEPAAMALSTEEFLDGHPNSAAAMLASISTDSDYPHFHESTHAWAVFADDPRKSATWQDRLVGVFIIAFQLYTYTVFGAEAVQDYQAGQVPVMIRHDDCQAAAYQPDANFHCEAQYTNNRDAFVAFFMLGIFLSGDMIQALRVLADAPSVMAKCFALLAFAEVVGAFCAACLAVSYNLYIGEVTDAIEVGVGLLFIRELSSKTYAGIRNGKRRQYQEYISCLIVLILIGMATDPLCARWLAAK